MAEVHTKVTLGDGIGEHAFVRITWDDRDEGLEVYGRLVDEWTADRWGTQTRSDVESAATRLLELRAAMPGLKRFKQYADVGWYLEEIVRLARRVREEIQAGEADKAAIEAEQYGYLRSELRIKLEWERVALAGKRSRDGAQQGGQGRGASDKIADRRIAFFASYDEAISRNVPPTIARQKAVKMVGYSDDHGRKLLRRR